MKSILFLVWSLCLGVVLCAPITSKYFGMTVLDFENTHPQVLFGTTRTWDSHPNLDWSDVNTALNTYRWQWIDEFLANNTGRDIIYTFGRTPQWASSQPNKDGPYGPGQCAPPSSTAYWEAYVTALVNHTQGKIKYYEIWNEPNDPDFFCGNISTLVFLADTARTIIKKMQPDATILSPATTEGSGITFMNSFLQAGGGRYVDAIAFHGYWGTPSAAEYVLSIVQQYKDILKNNGLPNLPLWDTEASWATAANPPVTDADKGSWLAKYYMLQYSAGVERFIWYAYDASFWGGLYNTTTNQFLLSGVAYNVVYNWMVGSTLSSPCSMDNATNIWTCPFVKADNSLSMAIWNSNSSVQFSAPAGYTRYQDLQGKSHNISGKVTISNSPILLEKPNVPTPSPTSTPTTSSSSPSSSSSSSPSTSSPSATTSPIASASSAIFPRLFISFLLFIVFC